jgi:hypothetical protein
LHVPKYICISCVIFIINTLFATNCGVQRSLSEIIARRQRNNHFIVDYVWWQRVWNPTPPVPERSIVRCPLALPSITTSWAFLCFSAMYLIRHVDIYINNMFFIFIVLYLCVYAWYYTWILWVVRSNTRRNKKAFIMCSFASVLWCRKGEKGVYLLSRCCLGTATR